ncbi:glycosyltransferase family 2 protein [Acinetobacter colistiniresistens]|uniref:glycosyltransferase family 2 protein n=1 Tax=Acinetobacter colistiniresistens TaxID=280145 RepID=UPI000E5A2D28|nr:glycosyltransferase [Acinetobacter colistiniresistens]
MTQISHIHSMICLSIIIPVYNVEKYIQECLLSIYNQIESNIEVIINDGSTDHSAQIIDEFTHKLPSSLKQNFIVIHQNNQGVSHSRNNGIQQARGNYITFIDSDDIIADHYISNILFAIKKSPDLVQFNAYCFFESAPEKNYHLSQSSLSGLHKVNDELLCDLFNKNNWFSWLRVYKRELLLDNPFPTNMTHFEDAFIVSKILSEIENIFMIKQSIYHYRILENSATRENNLETKNKLLNSCSLLIKELIKNSKKREIFAIPLLHFSYIYLDESKKSRGYFITNKNWKKIAKEMKNLKLNLSIIQTKREKLFFMFRNLGTFGHYLARKLSKVIK